MSDLYAVVIRSAGLNSTLERQLLTQVERSTGLAVHHLPLRSTDQHLDLDVLGTAFDGVAMLVSAVALYFQLRARKRSADDTDVVDEALALAAGDDGTHNVPAEDDAQIVVSALASSVGSGTQSISAMKVDTPRYSVAVELDDGVLMVSVTPHR